MRIAVMTIKKDRCMNIIKITENDFNKIFLLKMNNEYEMIARIFTFIAELAHYTIASEVAIMNFLRTRLNILALRIFT